MSTTTIDNLLARARRLVSPAGDVEWVVLRPEDWKSLVEFLEDMEDLAVLQEIEEQGEEEQAIPLEKALNMLREEGVDV